MKEEIVKGIAASSGLVLGNILVVSEKEQKERIAGTPQEEETSLQSAIITAIEQIEKLAEQQDETAAEILEFQSMLLEDDDLLEPVFNQIKSGTAADDAWAKHLDQEIAEYKSADDEYMAARGDDLQDLKSRVLDLLLGVENQFSEAIDQDTILLMKELTPSQFLELNWNNLSKIQGIATLEGSKTSHVSILARARGIPLIVGLNAELKQLSNATPAILDAENGELILNPKKDTAEKTESRLKQGIKAKKLADIALAKPAMMQSGEHVKCMLNVDDPDFLESLDVTHCDGIGLTRTEFLFHNGQLPSEDEQYAVYSKILKWAKGRTVTIRTLDAGGDKPIAGVTIDNETNPFLGVRGLRLSLLKPDIFQVQLRALARAATHGNLKVMVPMVTVPEEMQQFRELMNQVVADLASEGIEHKSPALGMMVEVPSAAIMAEDFDADFYSIGSNDLVQYVTASARDNAMLAELADSHNPAVLKLIGGVVKTAKQRKVDVSICGDMASDPLSVSKLLMLGVRSLSIAPAQLGKIKIAISEL